MATGDTALMDAGIGAAEVAPPEETQVVETGAEGAELGGEPEAQQEETQVQSFGADGKPTSQALKSAFSKLAEGDKKLADHIRGQYFKANEVLTMFPNGLADARALKETFDALGGEEGIQELHQEAEEYATELTMVAEGNPEILDNIIANSRDGFVKLMGAGFDKLKALDTNLYGQLALSGFGDILKRSGFPDGLNTLVGGIMKLALDIQEGKQERAFEAAQNLHAWFKKFSEMDTRKELDEPNRESETLQKERRELAMAKENIYRENFNSSLNKQLVMPAFQKEMQAFLKGKQLTTPQKQKIESDFYAALSQEFSKDASFTKKRDMLLQRHDDAGLMSIYRPRIGELAPRVFKSVRDSLGWSAGITKQSNNGASGAQSAPVFGSKPDASEIDWTKDRSHARYMGKDDGKGNLIGEATLKNGKIRRWNWNMVK
jgi:hypothetical protein